MILKEIKYNLHYDDACGDFIYDRYTGRLTCITKTRLYNFDLLKPHFYIVKTGVYRGIYYFSYFCSKIKIVGTR